VASQLHSFLLLRSFAITAALLTFMTEAREMFTLSTHPKQHTCTCTAHHMLLASLLVTWLLACTAQPSEFPGWLQQLLFSASFYATCR
jgi:hypothetical protein